MATKRTPIGRASRPRLTPDLRVMAERYVELAEAHMTAIVSNDDAFYRDGRHQELVQVSPQIHAALGIKPWTLEPLEIVRAALGT